MAKHQPDFNNSQENEDLLAEMLKKLEQDKKSKAQDDVNEQNFLRAITSECKEVSRENTLDGSSDLIQGLEMEDKEDEEQRLFDFPHFKIYAGENGTFELCEKGCRKVQKITETEYPLPIDTDITKINAYRIAARGDWSNIKDAGAYVINATLVEFESCYDLEKLPPMNIVQKLKVNWCYNLHFFDSLTRVKEVEISHSGIQFLPKSLSNASIKLDSCDELKYIHPAIPVSAISGLEEKEIRSCKIRYMLSEHVPDSEKRNYPIMEKNVLIKGNLNLKTLPECFNRPNVILENCDKLEFIHPSIDPKKIQGMSKKDIYRCQMMYLFKKMNDNDPAFDFWFKRVKANMGRTRE